MKISVAPKLTPRISLPAGERPPLRRQPGFPWPALIELHVHPVKVGVIEALRWVGGPVSAKELWRLGVGEPDYGIVAYHVKALADHSFLEHVAASPARGSAEKFYVLTQSHPGGR